MAVRALGSRRPAAPLISTKIAIPRKRGDVLRRTRLVDAIHNAIDRQLFLVVAPAGYGKTTLLVDFASDSDIPVCWYSLTPQDAEPAVFLDYLVASIEARFPRFGAETRRVMAQVSNFRTDAFSVVAALINEIQERIPEYFAVVLDDYHEVSESREISELVDALLKHAPENLQLIVSSRTMPHLQLARLAALRQAGGVGANDLRFTSDEVRDLMRESFETELPPKVVEELTLRSEGWITGIILTTHTMWQGLFESMIQNSGQEQLYSYLANEVFERQDPEVQAFLLATSILDDMEPAIAGALAGVSRANELFVQLKEGNLFVTELQTRKRVYRYHHLFRDFLRARLDREGPDDRARLERAAGLLYQQRGQHEQAIGHLLMAGEFVSAADSIIAIAEAVFNAGRLDALAQWIDTLPDETRTQRPRLMLWRAQVAIQKGELQLAVTICQRVEEHALSLGQETEACEARLHRAAALRLLGDTEQAVELCQQVLQTFGNEVSQRRAFALRVLGTAYWRLGELVLSRECALESHRLYESLGDKAAAAYLRNDLGNIANFLGMLGEARQQLELSAAYWRQVGNVGRLGLTISNLGWVAYLEEDYGEAIRLFEEAIRYAQAGLFTYAEGLAACSLGDAYRDLGEFRRAEAAYDKAHDLVLEGTDRAELAVVLNSTAHSYRLQGKLAKAEGALRRARANAAGYRLAQIDLTSGICAAERGSYARALRFLETALQSFRVGGARYGVARALFHLGFVFFKRGDLERSDALLEESLSTLEDLGFSQFFSVDAPRCLEFVQQAADRDIGGAFLKTLLNRAVQKPSLPRVEPAVASQSVAGPRIRVRMLGALEVTMDGRQVSLRHWGTQAARELFFYLLLHREGATKDRLMDLLAPEVTPSRANSQFHVAAYRLRRALYRGALQFDGTHYHLDSGMQRECDVDVFCDALAAAKNAKHGSAEEALALRRATEAYGGRFLEGLYSEWIEQEQRRLESQFFDACSRLAWSSFHAGDFRGALATAERALNEDDSLQDLHEVVVRSLLALDRRGEATRHLEAYAKYLDEELGAELPEELRRILDADTAGKPRLLLRR